MHSSLHIRAVELLEHSGVQVPPRCTARASAILKTPLAPPGPTRCSVPPKPEPNFTSAGIAPARLVTAHALLSSRRPVHTLEHWHRPWPRGARQGQPAAPRGMPKEQGSLSAPYISVPPRVPTLSFPPQLSRAPPSLPSLEATSSARRPFLSPPLLPRWASCTPPGLPLCDRHASESGYTGLGRHLGGAR
eukprot:1173784-Rhodomonas_salina.1